MNEEALFAAALEKPTRAQRAAFLAESCGGDVSLRQRVDRLLFAHERAGGILDLPTDGASPAIAPWPATIAEGAGDCIGPYRLIEQIGEGGFGLVFAAEQLHPIRREVAIKIIKPGMDTREVVARFEAERQALAMMDHPNIAKVFDGGEIRNAEFGMRSSKTPLRNHPSASASSVPHSEFRLPNSTGRPYFVMELVRGVAITDYCDQQRLTTTQRLGLFVTICDAVQHAHQKGIIHRDLKPSNLLVGTHDGEPLPKVIDFGIAKALNQQLTEHSIHTRAAQMIGTPAYMSPEQAEPGGQDIDTRSDIYSLGVVLYELLTGTTPFDKERLKTASFDELRRILREEGPPKPSTRVSTLGQAATTASACRQSDPRRLSDLLRGELDWIVMKALEKDRGRRYETASAFAKDVRRFLASEPVEACPPSVGYRLRKFVRRHRGPVLAATTLLLLLVGGVIGTTWGMLSARDAWHAEALRAESESRERRRANAAEAEALQQEKDAKSAAKVANGILGFVRGDLLGRTTSPAQVNRTFTRNPNLTMREALDQAAAGVGHRFKDQPEVEAGIRRTLGEAYFELGQFEQAIVQLTRASDLRAPRDHPETIATWHSLALAYGAAGKTTQAVELMEKVRDAWTEKYGRDDPHVLTILNNLARAYYDAGRTNEAFTLFKQVADAKVKSLGSDDHATLVTLHNLATLYMDSGQTAEAIKLFEQVMDAKIKKHGPDHADILPTLNNLAKALWVARELDRSIPLFEQVLSWNRRLFSDSHPQTLGAMANLGVNYRDAERLPEAIRLLEQAHREGREHATLRWVGGELLIAYARAGKRAETAELAKELVVIHRRGQPAESSQLAALLVRNGQLLMQVEAWADAEIMFRDALIIREKTEPDDWTTFNTRSLRGGALLEQKRYAEAEPLLVQGYEGMKQREAKMPAGAKARLAEAAERLVQLYEAWGKPSEADKWRKEI